MTQLLRVPQNPMVIDRSVWSPVRFQTLDKIELMENAGSFAQTEINWDKVDKSKLYVVGVGMVTVALYPISVVKTWMQVATKDRVAKSAYAVIRGLLKTERGAFPSFKMVEPSKLSDPTKSAIDVISQRLMVRGYSTYNGGVDIARKVLKQDGSSQRVIWSLLGHGNNGNASLSSQGTIKTQLQVMGHNACHVIKTSIADDDRKGFYNGIGPRFFSTSTSNMGTSESRYEYLTCVALARLILGHPPEDLTSIHKVVGFFEYWVVAQRRSYNNLDEKLHRFEIFINNLRFINEENKKANRTYWLRPFRLADMTHEEVANTCLGRGYRVGKGRSIGKRNKRSIGKGNKRRIARSTNE